MVLFGRVMRRALAHYEPRPLRRNEDLFDRAGEKWVADRRNSLVVCEADKGLGDCLVGRPWLEQRQGELLNEACVEVPPSTWDEHRVMARDRLGALLDEAVSDKQIPSTTKSWVMACASSDRSASFRVCINIHKIPPKCRLIMNFSNSFLQGASTLLGAILHPAVRACPHVVENSHSFLEKHGSTSISDDVFVIIADVENLYPSVDHDQFLLIFQKEVHRHWHKDVR